MSRLTSLPGIELPIIQAPMAGVQDEALAVAVSTTGALGSMPCALLSPSRLKTALESFATLRRPINLNFFCHAMGDPDVAEDQRWRLALAPYYREFGVQPSPPSMADARRPLDAATVDLIEPFAPRIVSFHFGLPEATLLDRMRDWGAVFLASATTLDEALWLQDRGVDFVIAQGIEAGGHRGMFLSADLTIQRTTAELVGSFCRELRVPVIAAGGITRRTDVEAMLALGACAVQAGTAYLCCPEATTSAVHRAALREDGRESAVTNLFSGRPARGLMNRLMRDLGPMSPLPPAFPWASQALAPLRAAAEARGLDDFTPLWSGSRNADHLGLDAKTVTRRLAGIDSLRE